MAVTAFDSPLLGGLFGDAQAAAILSDSALVDRMIAVEAALATATAEAGLIPADAGARIAARLGEVVRDCAAISVDLGPGMRAAGVAVPALVARLGRDLGADAAFLHWGATSQDIVDTAVMMQWKAMLALLAERLGRLISTLKDGADAQAHQPMAARTRSQIATPISFGLRIAHWAQPLIAAEASMATIGIGLLRVQSGGAAGSGAMHGRQAAAVSARIAELVGLGDAPSWHTDRSGIVALAGWLGAVAAGLAKMARDLIVMGRSESAEATAGTGGGSSTMPQKANPVAAEAIVTLADFVAILQPALTRAASPLEERDGAAWALEWLALPQMGVAVAAALAHAQGLADSLAASPRNMQATLAVDHGAVMAEEASFALAEHMPRAAAQEAVKRALAEARHAATSLTEALASDPTTGGLEHWHERLAPERALEPSTAMMRRIFATRQTP
jgi:3-carboxy-cis,cis-muconate cycloisomerase